MFKLSFLSSERRLSDQWIKYHDALVEQDRVLVAAGDALEARQMDSVAHAVPQAEELVPA